MKKQALLSLLCLVLTTASTTAQIQIGDAETPTMNRAGRFSEDDLATLKKTTTVFVLQTGDANHIEDFEQAIGQVWKITPYKVILPEDMNRYAGREAYSLFGFGGFIVQNAHNGSTSTHITYDLRIPHINRKGEADGSQLAARFVLSPDEQTLRESSRPINTFGRRKQEDNLVEQLYTTSHFANWGPGFIKGYLKVINDRLATMDRQGMFSENNDEQAVHRLAKDTLYIPNYVNNTYNMFSGHELENSDDDRDAGDAYPYPVKYVSEAALNDMIVHRSTPFYYLLYIRSSSDKYVNVYEGTSGRPVYANYSAISYNFKKKDLAKLAKMVGR